jgi:hypothetical protein
MQQVERVAAVVDEVDAGGQIERRTKQIAGARLPSGSEVVMV